MGILRHSMEMNRKPVTGSHGRAGVIFERELKSLLDARSLSLQRGRAVSAGRCKARYRT
jgi:hypothetical protein